MERSERTKEKEGKENQNQNKEERQEEGELVFPRLAIALRLTTNYCS